MDLTCDSQFNIAFIRLRRKIARVTTVAVSDELNVDVGPDGRIYGIELLNANPNSAVALQKYFSCGQKL